MKSKKLIFTIIIGLLIVPVLSMTVSLSHIEQLANISNYPWASWFLACGIEIGSIFLFLALLFKLSSDNRKALAWLAFFILSIVQLIGNTYAGFVHINHQLASNIHYLDNLMEITFHSVDASLLKLIVSSIFGVLIVFLSLICMHFSLHLVEKYKNYREEEVLEYDIDEVDENDGDDEEESDEDDVDGDNGENNLTTLRRYPFPADFNDGINDGDAKPSEDSKITQEKLDTIVDKAKAKSYYGDFRNLKWVNPENISTKNYGEEVLEDSVDKIKEEKSKRKYTKKNKDYWGDDILPIVEPPVNVSRKTADESYVQKELDLAVEDVEETVKPKRKYTKKKSNVEVISDSSITNNNP